MVYLARALKIEEVREVQAGDYVARVRRVSARSYSIRTESTARVRWADTVKQVNEDLAHLAAFGTLPLFDGRSWA